MSSDEITREEQAQLQALASMSTQLGNDPLQIQGAGGNTSIKQGDIMWIKASGKWLMHASQEELFVPVRRPPLLQALQASDPRAEKSVDFIVDELNPHGLRPSIETSLHAVLSQRVVIHVHCVDTIALAIRHDAQSRLTQLLAQFNWKFIPYIRPGLPLSRSIASIIDTQTDVLVLGNHGLVVAANSIDACGALLNRVRLAVAQIPRKLDSDSQQPAQAIAGRTRADDDLAHVLEGSDYIGAEAAATHAVAFDETGLQVAAGGSLYPDHVIFLGRGTVIARAGENAEAVVNRYASEDLGLPVSIVFPGIGVAMLRSATPGQKAMARCLSDVCLRVPEGVDINYLSEHQNHELLNWEAEQYRQTLNNP